MKAYTNPIVIYDIESTCGESVSRSQRETIEIGAVMLINGNICKRFDKYIKPKNNPILTKYCLDLTHIKQESIDAAEPFGIVFPEFMEWCENSIMCSWTGYDSHALLNDIHRNHVHGYARTLLKNKVDIKDVFTVTNNLGPKFKDPHLFSLEDALKASDINFEGSQHRAIDDAINTASLYLKHRKRIDHVLALRYPDEAAA